MHSTSSPLKRRTDFDCATRAIHSNVKLIFLAASILAQVRQRTFPEGDPMEKRGPPHFLHLAATVMSTYFIVVSCGASYKEETKRLVFSSQSPQNGLVEKNIELGRISPRFRPLPRALFLSPPPSCSVVCAAQSMCCAASAALRFRFG